MPACLVSVLDEKGAPTIVEKTKIRPPESRMGPATANERKEVISDSPVREKYDQRIDRKSAFELLSARADKAAAAEQAAEKERRYKKPRAKKRTTRRSSSRSTTNTVIRSVTKIVTSRVGQQLVRGILGSLFKGK